MLGVTVVKLGEVYTIGKHILYNGDCLQVLKSLDADSIDSLVTDPPAGIGFMSGGSKDHWDSDKGGSKQWIDWMRQVMSECLRVMKPGAHGLVWALPRTSHWTATALEDAGFRVKDCVQHLFGSGFPKSHSCKNIGRPELGSALKPSAEFWWLVQKPLDVGLTIDKNVQKWATGALEIDRSRVLANSSYPAITFAWEQELILCGSCVELVKNSQKPTVQAIKGSTVAVNVDSKVTEKALGRQQVDTDSMDTGCSDETSKGHTSSNLNMSSFGRKLTDQSQVDTSSIISTNEKTTTGLKICSLCELENISNTITLSLTNIQMEELLDYIASNGDLNTQNTKLSELRPCENIEERTQKTLLKLLRDGEKKIEKNISNPNSDITTKHGRWPSHSLFSHNPDCVEVSTETVSAFECTPFCPVAELDRQSGVLHSHGGGTVHATGYSPGQDHTKGSIDRNQKIPKGDSGGASRFFYCSKPSKREKNAGCEGLPEKNTGRFQANRKCKACGYQEVSRSPCHCDKPDWELVPVQDAKNHHPTVKSTKLMSYLINMITPPDGIILDCFGGSGTTLIAAHMNRFKSILIEQSTEYCDIILARAEHMTEKSAVRTQGK